MPAYVRFDIYTRESWAPIVHTFRTETEAHHWASNFLPRTAKNFDCWWEDPSDHIRQKPTMAYVETMPQTAWEATTGRPIIDTACPLEIVAAARAPRRGDHSGIHSPRVAHLTTGYETNAKAKVSA